MSLRRKSLKKTMPKATHLISEMKMIRKTPKNKAKK
jgi:hypothetical protein